MARHCGQVGVPLVVRRVGCERSASVGGRMATHNIPVSDDLWAELLAKSAAEGKAIEELTEEVLRRGLDDRSWQELLAYGAERGSALEFREEQAGDVVLAWRKDQRGQ